MLKLASRLALLTLVGAMGVSSVSFAAPPPNGVDCRDPANAKNPACTMPMKGDHKPGMGMQMQMNDHKPTGNPPMNGGNPPPMNNNMPSGNPPNNNSKPSSQNWQFNNHDKDQFHQRFGAFNFGMFPAPGFSITLGVPVPHAYHTRLKPVPYSVYKYYPQFRGYLYFINRGGDFVVVSPWSFKVVAIL